MEIASLQELHRLHDEGWKPCRFLVDSGGIVVEFSNGQARQCDEFGIGKKDRATYAFSSFVEKVMGFPTGSCFLHFLHHPQLLPGERIIVPTQSPTGNGTFDPTIACEHDRPQWECEVCNGDQ